MSPKKPEDFIDKLIYSKYKDTLLDKQFDITTCSNWIKPVVFVDKREFSSYLPSYLYFKGYWTIPK